MAETPALLAWLAHLLTLPEEMDEVQINLLEMRGKMSELTDAVADLQGAVGDVATKLDEQADRIEALEAGSTEAAQAASAIRGLAAQLRDSVANPDLPDTPPTSEPEPAPEG